jgi:type III secretion protein D
MPGDPAYIVTADGARYFVGATLPSGHRITAITGQRVSLERAGQATTLNL